MIPTSKKVPTDRPAELVAFLAIAPAVYGWLVSVSCPNVLAVVLAFIAGNLPLLVSTVKDARAPADGSVGQLPAADLAVDPTHEQHGIDHGAESANH